MRGFALAAVVLTFAGCASSPPGLGDGLQEGPASRALEFGEAGVAVEPCSGKTCWEPSVAVDPQGRIFAVEAGEWAMSARPVAPVAVSHDGGQTFTHVAPPPPITQAPPGTKVVYGDIMVDAAPSGRLFWSAIVDLNAEGGPVLNDMRKARPLNWAIQVAWSDDAGQTWNDNQELSGVEHLPDRQWLAFDGQTVYLAYNTVGTGVLLSRSDDGGSTWGPWIQVAPLADGPQWAGAGPPVVNQRGTVFVPVCNYPGLATTIFRSSDRGATFTSSTIPIGCTAFPILATRGDDLVLAVHNYEDGNVYVVRSKDQGATFAEPVLWGESIVSSPWPVIRADGSVAVAWYKFTVAPESELHVTVGDAAPHEDVVVAKVVVPSETDRTEAALTHFAHAALTPDGRLVVTWVDGPRVRVAVQGKN